MSNLIDLYSDTQTRPTKPMRQAMANAPVGDEQGGLDPTVNELCARVADLLGKEAAVFLPSGTMCNEIAILVHCRPGDEIIAHETAHILNFEGGGPAAFAGAGIYPLRGEGGQYDAADVAAAIRFPSRYDPRSRLLVVEQTSNMGGGSVWPLARVQQVAQAARDKGLGVHMDGARLMNAVVASGVSPKDFAAPCDSVWLDLTKGLGCPVGAVLAGSKDFIDEAWRWKQRMGGAMRQAGIIAAAGLYALDHHVQRLAEDHGNARAFAEAIADHPAIRVDPKRVETNLVFFDLVGAQVDALKLAEALRKKGVRIGPMGPARMRAVTHLDVTRADVEQAAQALLDVLEGRRALDG